MTTLEAVLGRRPSFEETMAVLTEGFRAVHGLELAAGGLAAEELELADCLVRDKYGTDRWTRSGRAMTVTIPAAPHPALSPEGRGLSEPSAPEKGGMSVPAPQEKRGMSVPSPPKGERAG
jgi:hypothetical protein